MSLLRRLAMRAWRPVDIASLAAFRIVFGVTMVAGLIRFLASGWIERMYGEPRFFFHYPGFAWVTPWPVWGMYAHYGVLTALALAIALGAAYRIAVPLFVLGFAYTQLIDVTNYLNHHYLVVLLGVLLAVLPAHAAWSIDAWRRPALRRTWIPAWMLWLVRVQVGVVYVFAGLAKAQPDWLVHAQPLNIWLSARTETPVIGPWLDERWVAHAMSVAGFFFDTTIVLWLSWRPTRLPAYAAAIAFHGLTGYFFNIGMFPFIMTGAALIFFSPGWPRRLAAAVGDRAVATPPALPPALTATTPPPWTARRRLAAALIAAHVALQIALPLRHWIYPGALLWNEDGMRFAWQVMVREKHGSVTFVVRFPDGRRLQVPPQEYLTWRQEREMAGQPDLIAQLARRIGDDYRARGAGAVEVHAEAQVSLNGRPPAPMIDPDVDLAAVRDRGPRTWVLPAPAGPPIHLRPVR